MCKTFHVSLQYFLCSPCYRWKGINLNLKVNILVSFSLQYLCRSSPVHYEGEPRKGNGKKYDIINYALWETLSWLYNFFFIFIAKLFCIHEKKWRNFNFFQLRNFPLWILLQYMIFLKYFIQMKTFITWEKCLRY